MVRMMAMALTAAVLAGASATPDERSRLTGIWEFNRTASDFGPGNSHRPKKLTTNISQDNDTVRMTWSGLDPEGKSDDGNVTFIVDGQEHPSTAPASTGLKTYKARWEGGRLVIDKVAKSWTEEDVLSVSDNGQRMTLDRTHHSGHHGSNLKFVYDRVK